MTHQQFKHPHFYCLFPEQCRVCVQYYWGWMEWWSIMSKKCFRKNKMLRNPLWWDYSHATRKTLWAESAFRAINVLLLALQAWTEVCNRCKYNRFPADFPSSWMVGTPRCTDSTTHLRNVSLWTLMETMSPQTLSVNRLIRTRCSNETKWKFAAS